MLSHGWLWAYYYTCVCLFLPFWCHFFLLFILKDHMGQWYWCICFYFPNHIFSSSIFIGVTVKSWLLIGWKNRFFDGFTGWGSSGYASTIFSLRCDRLVNGFECGALFIGLLTGSLLGVSFRLPMWLKPLEVMLGGLIFRIFPLGHSRLPCVHSLI